MAALAPPPTPAHEELWPAKPEVPTPQPHIVWAKDATIWAWRLWNTNKDSWCEPLLASQIPRDNHQGSDPQVRRDRMPQPQKFSGDQPSEDVDDALFAFENYLKGTNTPEHMWPMVAMPLLAGSAAKAFTAYAQQMQSSGQSITWTHFKEVLLPFSKPDKQLKARRQLFTIRQQGSVADFYQAFQLLLFRTGSPRPTDTDLILHYYNGLNPQAQASSRVDPTTGTFWSSFEGLTKHTLSVSLSHMATEHSALVRPRAPPPWSKLKLAHVTHPRPQDHTGKKRPHPSGGRGGGGRAQGRGRGQPQTSRGGGPQGRGYAQQGAQQQVFPQPNLHLPPNIGNNPCGLPGHNSHTVYQCRSPYPAF